MKFSECFGVQTQPSHDWFDPILSVDTRLFVDPFLIYSEESDHFEGTHEEILDFFNAVFQMVARSGGERTHLFRRRAEDSLRFPEVQEVCLGYTAAGTRGAGSGKWLAETMAAAMWEAIEAGMTHLTHFEEIAILREGIGADRISDATAAIIRHRLAAYTLDICRLHGIPVQEFNFLRGRYDHSAGRWIPLNVSLPRNPYNNRGILLIPRRFLRDLPTVNADDFWDYAYVNENESIRNDFSFDITSHMPKSEIVAFARKHPALRAKYLEYREQRPLQPYPLTKDPRLLYNWYDASKKYVQSHPVAFHISSEADFSSTVGVMIGHYREFVEQNKGWRLLWNDNNTPRREEAAQDLFLGIVKHYCASNDIDVSREADLGRGPVDFKVSAGYHLRALIEVKLAKNTKFWSGLEKQLPTYQKAEGVELGYFLVIAYSDEDLKKLSDLERRVKKLNDTLPYHIEHVVVDARRAPPSASKL